MQILHCVQDDSALLEDEDALLEWIQAGRGIGFGLWAMGKLASAENADPSTPLIASAINFAQDDTFWGGEGLGVARVEVLRRNFRVAGDAEVTPQ